MNHTLPSPAGNLIASDWALSALRTVRDRLQSLSLDELADARDALACTLSEVVGGLSVARDASNIPATKVVRGNTRIDDGPDDFDLPPLSGGSPEAYEPTDDDIREYRIWCEQVDRRWRDEQMDAVNEGVELDSSHFTEADARAAGLAV